MTYLFFIGFILIFGSGYIFAGAVAIWALASFVALLLNKIFGDLHFPFKKKSEKNVTLNSTKVNLNDPIGALCVVAQRYNDFLFLKDLAFLEIQLFGRNSEAVKDLFRSAESDPRPEVCASCANKILMNLSNNRKEAVSKNLWTAEQERIWELNAPLEWRNLLKSYEVAS